MTIINFVIIIGRLKDNKRKRGENDDKQLKLV